MNPLLSLAVAFAFVTIGLVVMVRGNVLVQCGGLKTVTGVPVVLAGTAILAMGLMISTGAWLQITASLVHH